jgi:hypothetical protein
MPLTTLQLKRERAARLAIGKKANMIIASNLRGPIPASTLADILTNPPTHANIEKSETAALCDLVRGFLPPPTNWASSPCSSQSCP